MRAHLGDSPENRREGEGEEELGVRPIPEPGSRPVMAVRESMRRAMAPPSAVPASFSLVQELSPPPPVVVPRGGSGDGGDGGRAGGGDGTGAGMATAGGHVPSAARASGEAANATTDASAKDATDEGAI